MYVLLLPEGQMDQAWELPRKAKLFQKSETIE